jgi:hypothetical protein
VRSDHRRRKYQIFFFTAGIYLVKSAAREGLASARGLESRYLFQKVTADEQIAATSRAVLPLAIEKEAAENVLLYRHHFVDWMHRHSSALGRHQYPKTGNGLLQRPNHGKPD